MGLTAIKALSMRRYKKAACKYLQAAFFLLQNPCCLFGDGHFHTAVLGQIAALASGGFRFHQFQLAF